MDRFNQRAAFLADNGLPSAGWQPLPGDASARRYFRPPEGAAPGLMLMDSPPQSAPLGPFLAMAQHLLTLGFSAPRLQAAEAEQGFALIEDFGDRTFTRLLAGDPAQEEASYLLATDTLAALHRHPRQTALDLPAYDGAALEREAALFIDWYLPRTAVGAVPAGARVAILEALAEITADTALRRDALVLRDFHVDNLMRLEGREGLAQCGLLDFQDALLGSPAYDLMSLAEDARRDISPALWATIRDRYAAAMGGTDQRFERDFTVLAAQRHMKVAGIFVRLWQREEKPAYLPHVPRVLALLDRALAHDVCQPLARALARHAPGWRAGLTAVPQ